MIYNQIGRVDGQRLFISNYVIIVGLFGDLFLLNGVICRLVILIISAVTHRVTTNTFLCLIVKKQKKIVKMKTILSIFVIFSLTVRSFKMRIGFFGIY